MGFSILVELKLVIFMNKYLLLGNVYGIGGWQIYLEGRICHLLKKGFNVYVVSPLLKNKTIKLEFFKKVKIVSNNALFRNVALFTFSQRKRILDNILKFVEFKESDCLFVESTSIYSSLWGEILAKATKGKNFSYILNSHVKDVINSNSSIIDFFRFKYSQKLLAGMTPNTIQDILFQDECVSKEMLYSFKADGRDPLTLDNPLSNETRLIKEQKLRNTIVVGYFGNLDKPHVIELTERLSAYFGRHSNNTFLFLTIGSSTKRKIEKDIIKIIDKINNASTLNIPDLFPVPIELFELMDVCIGSWGSARTAARSLTKTIRLLNDTDVVAQGIIGITLKNGIYYDLPAGELTLEEYLDGILFTHAYDDLENNSVTEYPEYELVQKNIDNFIGNYFSNDNESFYPIEHIVISSKKERLMKIFNCIFGMRFADFLFMVFK